MRKTNVVLFAATGLLAASAIHAQTLPAAPAPAPAATVAPAVPVAPMDDAVATQLEKLQTEVMLLKAQTARAQAQADLDKASGVGASGGTSAIGMPAVKAIYGRGGALSATLRLNSGGVMDARIGDSVPGGYRVSRISAGTVTFSKGGREFRTGLTADMPALPTMQGNGLMVAPPLPDRS